MSDPTQPLPELPPVCQAEAWRRARLDYEAGASGPVAAERHGLSARTLRRRAAAEGWRRPARVGQAGALALLLSHAEDGGGGLRCAPERHGDDEIEDDPELVPFVAAHSLEIGAMLMTPRPASLARFAFRRSVERAAEGAPREAADWMRLVEQVRRAAGVLDRLTDPVSPADHARAALAAQMRDLGGTWPEDEPEDPGGGGR